MVEKKTLFSDKEIENIFQGAFAAGKGAVGVTSNQMHIYPKYFISIHTHSIDFIQGNLGCGNNSIKKSHTKKSLEKQKNAFFEE